MIRDHAPEKGKLAVAKVFGPYASAQNDAKNYAADLHCRGLDVTINERSVRSDCVKMYVYVVTARVPA